MDLPGGGRLRATEGGAFRSSWEPVRPGVDLYVFGACLLSRPPFPRARVLVRAVEWPLRIGLRALGLRGAWLCAHSASYSEHMQIFLAFFH